MQIVETDVLVIGGGLTGLTIAYLLQKENISVKIVEARNRLGGRINTIYGEKTPPIDMGATWVGKKHTALLDLLETLGIKVFDQLLGERAIFEPISTSPPQVVQLPPNTDPTFRIQGGTTSLINALEKQLQTTTVYKAQPIKYIEKKGQLLLVKSVDIQFQAKIVISTLPPNLLAKTIHFNPSLPSDLTDIMTNTHTWMGESIKVGLRYAQPFWKDQKTGGTIFSNVGPIPEMYDHSNYENTHYSLVGFMNGAYGIATKEHRLELILNQLRKYYGPKVDEYLSYEEAVWSTESFTYTPYDQPLLPHQNNGHSVFRMPYLNNQLFIAGSETAPNFPGYMEGAIQSAYWVSQQIKTCL